MDNVGSTAESAHCPLLETASLLNVGTLLSHLVSSWKQFAGKENRQAGKQAKKRKLAIRPAMNIS